MNKKSTMLIIKKFWKPAAQLLFLLIVISTPVWVPNQYIFRIIILITLYAIPAIAQNLLTGFTGILTLGQAGNFAIGAYTSVILMIDFNVPWPIAFLAAGIVSAISGLLIGFICLKSGGDYLTLMTIGFGEIVRIVILNWINLTRGPMGIPGVPPPQIGPLVINTPIRYFYLILICTVTIYLISSNIVNSYYGRALKAIRDDELVAAAMGINIARYKIFVFVISSLFVGLAGSLLSHYLRFVGPNNFTMDESLVHMQMAILGGLGSLPGSIIGSAVIISLPESLRIVQTYRIMFLGVLFVILMAWRPQGILGVGAWGRGGTGWKKIFNQFPFRIFIDTHKKDK